MITNLFGGSTPRAFEINNRLSDLIEARGREYQWSKYCNDNYRRVDEAAMENVHQQINLRLANIEIEWKILFQELEGIIHQENLEVKLQQENQDNPLDFTDGKLENGTQNFLWQIQHARLSSEIWEM